MASYIMLQGTSSHVGKSILTTALCRIFYQDGRRVVPFKAQNMALNSYVTRDGMEMGRAQAAQAEAAGIDPVVDMNPVLLKPTGSCCSQVIINGRPIGNMSAREYHSGYSLKAFEAVREALFRLDHLYDTLVIEGAGSPAEVNLKAYDIVNMRVAKHLQAPVLLVADIDRGGALAALVGTLELLDEEERRLVRGLVINKFRGDVTLLQPAVDFLQKKTGKPVLGIIPYIERLGIDEEDSVSLEEKQMVPIGDGLRIAVIQTPKISNFTDFSSLAAEPDVSLYYVKEAASWGTPQMILLPGSKNTLEDMLYLRDSGLADRICRASAAGVPVIGICGGYQMLGSELCDPQETESSQGRITGLGLLPLRTVFSVEKITVQVAAECRALHFMGQEITVTGLSGYEIHSGRTMSTGSGQYPFQTAGSNGSTAREQEGMAREDGLVFGTYIHGIFDHDGFRRQLLNALRQSLGMPPLPEMRSAYQEKQAAYDRLAAIVRKNLDMTMLAQIMKIEGAS